MADWDVLLEGATKRYGRTVALEAVTLGVRRGELLALLGPSGCGKTTTLRIVAGLVQPSEGTVSIQGRPVTDVPVHRRNIGMVFQNYALFPHLTVAANVAFGLEMRGVPRGAIRPRIREALELVRLPNFEDRYPHQLSGGQQQRVALARALVIKPAVLLLDEPFGALDKKLREGMQIELRQLQRQLEITTIFVTHDQEEALTLSDTVVVMRDGRVEQHGPPGEVYERPLTRFVADFIGASNFFHGRLEATGPGRLEVATREGPRLALAGTAPPVTPGTAVTVAVRPEKVRLGTGAVATEARNTTSGRVEQIVYRGSVTHYYLRLPSGHPLIAFQLNAESERAAFAPAVGAPVVAYWDAASNLVLRNE